MEAKNSPATPGLAHQAQENAVDVVRSVYGGTLSMRAAGERFLPKFPREDAGGYQARLGQAVLFNALKRTVGGLVGMVFREDPALGEDVPEAIRGNDDAGTGGHWENIDASGRHGAVFSRDLFEAALTDGHTLILVDYPPVSAEQTRTRAQELAAGLRPYWTHYLKQDLLSFRTTTVNGSPVLTQAVLRETASVYDGDFGEAEVEQVRVYRLNDAGSVEYSVWRKLNGKDVWDQVEKMGGTLSVPVIPIVAMYANRTGFLLSDPPLLDLAIENVNHYQVRSDRQACLHIASVPIPVFIGIDDDDDLTIGSDLAIRLPAGGDAKYLEPAGAALDSSRTELQDILQNMAALGLAMLQRDTRAAETAEAKRIDKSETNSRLASAARGLQDGLEAALAIHAMWIGAPDGGSCTVNREFEGQEIEPTMVKALSEMVGAGQLDLDTLWDKLKRGGVLPDDFDAELAASRIGEAGLSARIREVV